LGSEIDSPVGPAAGPNSQLTQNIVAAYLTGSRFIELKTVQIMDGEELRNCVARPCINATDECYNVEWSTELTVAQAFDEYVKAWFLVHVLGRELGLGTGILFNMSGGYSLDGIKSEKIDGYIEGMKSAEKTAIFRECYDWLESNLSRFQNFKKEDLDAIPAAVSTSITLSTLHGCPREEIEKIAHYLLTEKNIHTYIKCNPTLLGYEEARRILDKMGYGYVAFDAHHFEEDLQFSDAVQMLGRLKKTAAERALAFGVKITNTFPVDITRYELPGEEMYMSGRALYPLSVQVASRLSQVFEGGLPISYSGGADRYNIAAILGTGIKPVTVATTILKPGGYERLNQLAKIAESATDSGQDKIDVRTLSELADSVSGMKRYTKSYREVADRKTETPLALFDCMMAPCSESGCPINQQIPAYLEQVAKGDYDKAFTIIANDNALPSVTGKICDHQCQNKCTRLDYEDPLQIRNAKKLSSQNAQQNFTRGIKPAQLKSDQKVIIIGAGPAGIAAALYLRRNGVDVTVRERREKPMGIVSHVIPAFRITDEEVALDADMAAAQGVNFEFGAPEDYDLKELKQDYDKIIIATGAWKPGNINLENGGIVIDALEFLEASRTSGLSLDLGKHVAIIGGGDVAMDCARAAARNKGVETSSIVYRRTKDYMPAQTEEIELAENDGVIFRELLAPLSFEDNTMTCNVMELGDYDDSARRSVSPSGSTKRLRFDTVISAVGARVDTVLFEKNGIELGAGGAVKVNEACETSVPGVYVAGDCKAGPKTVVKAMADAKIIAKDILSGLGLDNDFTVYQPEACRAELIEKKGVLQAKEEGAADAARCLTCNSVCEICADVCPNRANITIDTGAPSYTDNTSDTGNTGTPSDTIDSKNVFGQQYQIIHMDAMCNECGNCGIFCPSKGNPYKDKFTVFLTEEDFADSQNKGVLKMKGGTYKVRLQDGGLTEGKPGDGTFPEDYEAIIRSLTESYPYLM
jgi:putative selenate reductase